MDPQKWLDQIQAYLAESGLKLLGAVLIVLIGWWVAKLVRRVLRQLLTRAKLDPTLVSFAASAAYVALMAFVIIAALSKLGVETTSFVAAMGAVALAIGFALQGSLANLAAGVLLVAFRPFKVDDFVEAASVMGTVEEVGMFTTQLKTPDNKTVIIPNAKLTGDNITNYTTKGIRRLDMVIGVAYREDTAKVKDILKDILASDQRILKDPEPTIGVLELADSSVNFAVRPWVSVPEYWDVYFDTMETAKRRFDEAGVSIPFPQQDVHIVREETA